MNLLHFCCLLSQLLWFLPLTVDFKDVSSPHIGKTHALHNRARLICWRGPIRTRALIPISSRPWLGLPSQDPNVLRERQRTWPEHTASLQAGLSRKRGGLWACVRLLSLAERCLFSILARQQSVEVVSLSIWHGQPTHASLDKLFEILVGLKLQRSRVGIVLEFLCGTFGLCYVPSFLPLKPC